LGGGDFNLKFNGIGDDPVLRDHPIDYKLTGLHSHLGFSDVFHQHNIGMQAYIICSLIQIPLLKHRQKSPGCQISRIKFAQLVLD
jgi:hypothetical protein